MGERETLAIIEIAEVCLAAQRRLNEQQPPENGVEWTVGYRWDGTRGQHEFVATAWLSDRRSIAGIGPTIELAVTRCRWNYKRILGQEIAAGSGDGRTRACETVAG